MNQAYSISMDVQNSIAFFGIIEELLFVINTEGSILYINQAVTTKLGYIIEEIINTKIYDLFPDDEKEIILDIINPNFHQQNDSYTFRFKNNQNNELLVETRFLAGSWNNQGCIFCISKELVKEQKTISKTFRLFDKNPAPMAIISSWNGNLIEVNDSFLDTFGYIEDELKEKTLQDFGLLVQPEINEKIITKLKNIGRIRDLELHVTSKNNKKIDVLFSAEYIKYHGEKCILIVMIDISDQVILRKRVEEQKQKLENIIDGTSLGTWEWNIQTGETIFNERWAEIIGYSLDELQPINIQTWINLTHKDDIEKSNILLHKHFIGENDFYSIECRMKHKDGRWIWVLDCGKVIEWDDNGQPLKMFGTHTDITEKKISEQQLLLKNEELLIKDYAISSATNGMAFSDLNGFITYANKSFCDLWELDDINDVIGKNITAYWQNETKKEEILETLKMTGKCYGEKTYTNEENSTKYIEYTSIIVKDQNSHPICIMSSFIDITKRKLSEYSINEKVELFQGMFLKHSAIKMLIDPDTGAIVEANPSAAKFYGYNIDTLKSMNISQINVLPFETTFLKMQETKESQSGHYIFSHRISSGLIKDVEVFSVPIELNNKVLLFSIIHDITERVRAEQALKESEARLYLALKASKSGIWERDLKTDKNIWSDLTWELYNIEKDSIEPTYENWKTTVYPDDLERVDSTITDAAVRGEEFETEWRVNTNNESTRWLMTRGMPIKNSNGELIKEIGIVMNVTERNVFEETLLFLIQPETWKKDLDFFQSITQYIAEKMKIDYVSINILDDNNFMAKTLAIFYNGKFKNNTSFILEETPCVEVIKNEICCIQNEVHKLYPNNKLLRDMNAESFLGVTLYNSMRKPIGLLIAVNKKPIQNLQLIKTTLKLIAMRTSGELERRLKERELEFSKEEAERANRLKSQFLANMSHEIRTPLNAILGFSEFIKDWVLTESEIKEYSKYIYISGTHLLKLINTILELSKIETGNLDIEKSIININEFLEEISAIIIYMKKNKNIEYSHVCDPEVPTHVFTDPTRLKQILLNLLTNALKFTENGSMSINVSLINISYLKFKVSDTGIGIPQEKMEEIFEPFGQVNRKISQELGGTGLGLAITKSLVVALGGVIWVDSEVNKGTSFYFTIDISKIDCEKGMNKPRTNIPIKNDDIIINEEIDNSEKKILVVEDNKENIILTQQIFEHKIKHKTFFVESAEEALEKIEKETFDLILMDIQLPEMDGLEATRRIRGLSSLWKDVPIIAVTAYATNKDIDNCLKAGCTDYISKPISTDILISKINRYLS